MQRIIFGLALIVLPSCVTKEYMNKQIDAERSRGEQCREDLYIAQHNLSAMQDALKEQKEHSSTNFDIQWKGK